MEYYSIENKGGTFAKIPNKHLIQHFAREYQSCNGVRNLERSNFISQNILIVLPR